MQQKIRIGILVNQKDQLQRWQVACAKSLLKNKNVEIVFIGVPKVKGSEEQKPLSKWGQIFEPNLFWKLFWKWLKPDQIKEVPFQWEGISLIDIEVKVKNNRFELLPEGVKQLQSFNVDVLLRFGWGILKGEILELPKFGVWSFHHNDPHTFRGGPPAFWEIYHHEKTQGAVLQRVNHKLDGGQILAETKIRTNFHSLCASYNEIVRESPILLQKAIAKTIRDQNAVGPSIDRKKGVFKTFPNNGQFLGVLCRVLMQKILFQWRKKFSSENWNIIAASIPFQSTHNAKISAQFALKNFKAFNGKQFKADPFLLPGDQGVLYELYDQRTKKAVIAWADLSGENEKTVLDNECHVSYPFVMVHDRQTFVFPEQKANKTLQVYKWSNENQTLIPSFTIAIPNCIDPTVTYFEGKWWLFTTHPSQSNAHLYIYYADQLEGPYQAHGQNPVKMDIQTARPAGQMFLEGGKLLRPTQNNAAFYGAGINWMQITRLTEDHFEEKLVQAWHPKEFGVLGMHHISYNESAIILDAKTKNAAF